jgi:hypothetical protein
MDIMDDGLLRFWKGLNHNGVLYIMVGGFAVNMHGYIRATADADLLLKDDLENRQRLRKAFSELGYGDFVSLETTQFVPGWSQFYIEDGIVLDIMTSLKGVDLSFDECLKMASVAELDGIKVPFLHINHLIDNKKVVNRPKDQLDVIELERIKMLREQND